MVDFCGQLIFLWADLFSYVRPIFLRQSYISDLKLFVDFFYVVADFLIYIVADLLKKKSVFVSTKLNLIFNFEPVYINFVSG